MLAGRVSKRRIDTFKKMKAGEPLRSEILHEKIGFRGLISRLRINLVSEVLGEILDAF